MRALLLVLVIGGGVTGQTPPPWVGLAAAERQALDWLGNHGLSVSGWTRTKSERRRSVSGSASYRFVWERHAADGVVLPAVTHVELSTAGEVTSLYRVDIPTGITAKPAVQRRDAERLAREAIRSASATVVAASGRSRGGESRARMVPRVRQVQAQYDGSGANRASVLLRTRRE